MTDRELLERAARAAGILPCPCCGCEAGLEEHNSIFVGQSYHDRYPSKVANQGHGFHVRCHDCGLQTCWWHYESEAVEFWNARAAAAMSEGG